MDFDARLAAANYEGEIQDYNKAIELNPNNAKAYYNRGASFEKVEKIDEAVQNYQKAIELNPAYKDELARKIDYLNYTFK